MVDWIFPPESPPELPPRPQKRPPYPHTTTPPPRSHPIRIQPPTTPVPLPSILLTAHPPPSQIHHGRENISNYGHTSPETRSREQTISRLEAQITCNRAPACWVESIGAGVAEEEEEEEEEEEGERRGRRREVYRSKDVVEVETGIDRLGMAQWAWECKVRAEVVREGREGRERELELKGKGEGDCGEREVKRVERRGRWKEKEKEKGKEKGKGKGKEKCDSFKTKWRDLMARMEDEGQGEEAVED
ncbi:hypothetical protein B5807_09498 [Epicoccum nigrum]|uniref:Uncharacterized protein n=1 Tax=Epicoccum nigrum TaxID=105696 RepID=A0A1Y2LPD1_EPING|nr:hypothetical protein B5807_09498 [Epicoccum nigrum]